MITLILIAFSLALDCFAVSLAGGAVDCKPKFLNVIKVALFFGLFQAIMPLIGWLIGLSFTQFISDYDHWIAFILLLAVGAKMIYESLRNGEGQKDRDILKIPTLLLLSVATSIDALVIGITLDLLNISLALSVLIIGAFAFVMSLAGYYIGHRLGSLFGTKVEIIGGIILIGIGLNTLAEHLGWYVQVANFFTAILNN
ncbi:MAG: manganese efflux pump MntP family protein [Actinomycetota bacterium]|nr:manganese efflux pump MntP family protein [Actinomycetota bacterium]